MKKHIPLLLALVLLFSLTACGKPTEKENPYRMKTYTSDWYEDGELTSRTENIYIYNDNGFLSQILISENGTHTNTLIYETDEYGNTTCVTYKNADGGSFVTDYVLTLDSNHRIIRQEQHETVADGTISALISIREAAYDKKGNQTQTTFTRLEDNYTMWTDYAYDHDGNLIEEIIRWNNGTEGITKENTRNYSITKYEYTEGKLTRCESYNYKDELEEYEEYTYDETGLIQTALRYHADGSPYSKTVTTFDEYGNMLTTEIYKLRDDGIEPVDDLVDLVYTATYEPIPNN